MIRDRLRNSHGFTLIEIITVIVVLGILSVFTFSFIDNAVKTYMIGSKQRMLYQEVSYAMERITRELRDAGNVSVDAATGGWSINKAHVSLDPITTVVFFRNSSNNLIRRTMGIDRIMAHNVDRFDPPSVGCISTGCVVTLQVTDSTIPIDGSVGKSILLSSTVTPKNNSSGYAGRDFNGHYEDVVQ
jgi:prepilin-type N-terminal cleavage/methylation domain-containing protein